MMTWWWIPWLLVSGGLFTYLVLWVRRDRRRLGVEDPDIRVHWMIWLCLAWFCVILGPQVVAWWLLCCLWRRKPLCDWLFSTWDCDLGTTDRCCGDGGCCRLDKPPPTLAERPGNG